MSTPASDPDAGHSNKDASPTRPWYALPVSPTYTAWPEPPTTTPVPQVGNGIREGQRAPAVWRCPYCNTAITDRRYRSAPLDQWLRPRVDSHLRAHATRVSDTPGR